MLSRGMTRSPGVGPSLVMGLLLLSGCWRAPRPTTERPPLRTEPTPRAKPLPRLGFTLQAGAFAKAENAARFSEALQAQGLEATYYASGDGLYRVRFGDFSTREKARDRGALSARTSSRIPTSGRPSWEQGPTSEASFPPGIGFFSKPDRFFEN